MMVTMPVSQHERARSDQAEFVANLRLRMPVVYMDGPLSPCLMGMMTYEGP